MPMTLSDVKFASSGAKGMHRTLSLCDRRRMRLIGLRVAVATSHGRSQHALHRH